MHLLKDSGWWQNRDNPHASTKRIWKMLLMRLLLVRVSVQLVLVLEM
jgi:hypothetical protein